MPRQTEEGLPGSGGNSKFTGNLQPSLYIKQKVFSTYVINAGDFGRVELFVVAAAGCQVEPSAAYPADEQAVVDGELDDTVEGLLPRLQ